MYLKDLELKGRYFEGECRRRGMLVQCCAAENQALRLSLQNAKEFDASMTKQESAVLAMESVLLGSLLPFLASCACSIFQQIPQQENVGVRAQRSLVLVRKPLNNDELLDLKCPNCLSGAGDAKGQDRG